jgi:hypothetical protein
MFVSRSHWDGAGELNGESLRASFLPCFGFWEIIMKNPEKHLLRDVPLEMEGEACCGGCWACELCRVGIQSEVECEQAESISVEVEHNTTETMTQQSSCRFECKEEFWGEAWIDFEHDFDGCLGQKVSIKCIKSLWSKFDCSV